MTCKFYALYGTRCGCDKRIDTLYPNHLPVSTISVHDHRACMGEITELCPYYEEV